MAGSFNRVILMGNLTRDPELRYTPQGKAVMDITLAINEYRARGAEGAEAPPTFVDVTLWERQAELVGEYLRKGNPVLIEGRLTQDRWDDKETGKKMSKLKVTATTMQFVNSARGNDDGGGSGGSSSGYGASAPAKNSNAGGGRGASKAPAMDNDFAPSSGDDIPF